MSLSDIVKRLFGAPAPDETATHWLKASDFGYPHSMVSPAQVPEALRAEDEIGAREGFTPVIIVSEIWNRRKIPPEQRTKRALRLLKGKCDASFGREFLARSLALLYESLALDSETDPGVFDSLQPVAPAGVEPGLWLLREYNRETRAMEDLPEVAIVRIPTTESHTILAYLDWGGWNAVPSSLELVAISRYWGERYGARLIAIGSDKLEFTVARKPADHAEAVALLKEQYCFAPDNWEYDRSGLEQAAAELRVMDTWFFWWD